MYDKSRRTKEKKIKNEREKAQAKIQAMNIGVKIRGLILKEDKAKRGVKERIIKAYREIYNRDVVMDIADALCAGDDFFEEYYEDKT